MCAPLWGFATMKWFLEILCYEQPRNWFIWHSPRESRLHCGPKNVCLIDIRKVCLNYVICTMCPLSCWIQFKSIDKFWSFSHVCATDTFRLLNQHSQRSCSHDIGQRRSKQIPPRPSSHKMLRHIVAYHYPPSRPL